MDSRKEEQGIKKEGWERRITVKSTCVYVYTCMYVSFCTQVKRLLCQEGKPLQIHERLLAGSTAGVIAQTLIYPMEVCDLGS